MVFEIQGKVGIVTGAGCTTGMGYHHARQLLIEKAKGVTLVDYCPQSQLQNTVDSLEAEFGVGKVIGVKADVRNYDEFENGFVKTVEKFQNVDILVNNAGYVHGGDWSTEISINVNGTVNGILLAMDKYLPLHKSSNEALIVNVSSIAGCEPLSFSPTYTGTKHAILGFTKAWGIPEFYQETNVRVIAICPGATLTSALDCKGRTLGGKYEKFLQNNLIGNLPVQEPQFVGEETVMLMKHAPNGTIWVIEGKESAYQYEVPHRTTMKNNVLKF